MGMEYYLFAGFVFALIGILILLVVFGKKRQISNLEKDLETKEKQLLELKVSLEETMEGLELFALDTEKKIKDEAEELRRLIIYAKTNREITGGSQNHQITMDEFVSEEQVFTPVLENNTKTFEVSQNTAINDDLPGETEDEQLKEKKIKEQKRKQVILLFEQGKKLDEISKQLSITKGEAKFILELYAKNKKVL